tara:strand:+ start:27 stop:1001 length:975 start_codon:yes stop_codon:yes gene_type:complete
MYKSFANKLSKHLRSELSLSRILEKMLNTLIPERWLIKPEYIFVNDLFVEDYVGGAELSLQTLIETSPSDKISKVRSTEVTKQLLDLNRDAKWIFGNISQLSNETIAHITNSGIKYGFVEFDYKFCKHRNPVLYQMVEGATCDYKNTDRGKIITDFVNSSDSCFFMSKKQLDIYKQNLPNIKNENLFVLSSLFDDKFFQTIEKAREKAKNKSDRWVVLGSRSWVKGLNETESHCKESGYKYDVLWNLPYDQFLEKMAEARGLCFKPTGLDTCPRMVIEAKLLDCELDINELVQHHKESWFNKSYEEMIKYLKSRPGYFWKKVFR